MNNIKAKAWNANELRIDLSRIQYQLKNAKKDLIKSIVDELKKTEGVERAEEALFVDDKINVEFTNNSYPTTLTVGDSAVFMELGMPGVEDPNFKYTGTEEEFKNFVKNVRMASHSIESGL